MKTQTIQFRISETEFCKLKQHAGLEGQSPHLWVRGVVRAVIASPSGPVEFATTRLADVQTMHAMTIHKSQGSQAKEVTVLLPPADSRLLTRELLYTAVTRARQRVRVVGSEDVVRGAVARSVQRASGLGVRLWGRGIS